ncbi:MAG TPA: hypothetical protein VE865_15380 [Bradyrhizobium sp.]|nr:hypothetical protein [Bradyrhizobium sp.]
MTTDLKDLMERAQSWPEAVRDELVAVASQIERELQGGDYVATREELQALDAAIASLEAGESASDAEIEAAFAKFRRA